MVSGKDVAESAGNVPEADQDVQEDDTPFADLAQ